MNNDDFGILMLVALVAFFTFIVIATWGVADTCWKRDAIANHAAHYELNPENGASTFVWGK